MSQPLKWNSHSLVPIPQNKWNILLDLYTDKRTEPAGYNVINNYIRWVAKEPDMDVQFLSLDDEWQKDGTFIIIAYYDTNLKSVFLNTLSDNLDRLTNTLLCLIPSSDKYIFFGYGERLLPAVDVYKKQYSNIPAQISNTNWYRASKEVVATFSIEPPPGIVLRKLETTDASTVNEIYPHRSDGSELLIKRMINHNISVGACDNNGKLVAWCLRDPLGALGMLQVVESHKRLGLGSLMVRCLAKNISEMDEEVLAAVLIENTPCLAMFKRLGFQKINKAYWNWY